MVGGISRSRRRRDRESRDREIPPTIQARYICKVVGLGRTLLQFRRDISAKLSGSGEPSYSSTAESNPRRRDRENPPTVQARYIHKVVGLGRTLLQFRRDIFTTLSGSGEPSYSSGAIYPQSCRDRENPPTVQPRNPTHGVGIGRSLLQPNREISTTASGSGDPSYNSGAIYPQRCRDQEIPPTVQARYIHNVVGIGRTLLQFSCEISTTLSGSGEPSYNSGAKYP